MNPWVRNFALSKLYYSRSKSVSKRITSDYLFGYASVLPVISLKSRKINALYVQEQDNQKPENARFDQILELSKNHSIPIKYISKHDLNHLSENRPHQGVVLETNPIVLPSKKFLTATDDSPFWVALDQVVDPQNLGAILRSCFYFGANGIVLCDRNSSPLTPAVSRASAGALEVLAAKGSIWNTQNLMDFLSESRQNGWRILGTTSSARESVPVWRATENLPRRPPTILVFGSEGAGVRTNILRLCDDMVTIPSKMSPEDSSYLDSLNVGVAMGIFLYDTLLRSTISAGNSTVK